jgi:gamma-glutamyl hercynylcysteine S-oxide hydrolase
MCRHLAWIGRPRTLAALLLDPPHGLLRQSYAPREQRHGKVNADGFGVGWYAPDVRREPARYRRAQPIWTDASFASLAGVVSSRTVLAAIRSATPPFPIDEAGAAPFTAGPWLFSHNGRVDDFPRASLELRSRLPAAAAAGVEGPSDAALLWALLRHRLELGQPLPDALTAVVSDAVAVGGGRLNLLATDGQTVAATTYGDTLYTRRDDDGVLVASEPTDDLPGWERVPDRSLVVATPSTCDVTPLAASLNAPIGDRT